MKDAMQSFLYGFEVTRAERLGGRIAPLCYLEAVLPANDRQADSGPGAVTKEG